MSQVASEGQDFKLIQKVGFGNFGTIYLAEDDSESLFAVKIIKKLEIVSTKQVKQVIREKTIMEILSKANCVFVPKFLGTSQSSTELVIKMEMVRGCQLQTMIQQLRIYYQFYLAEIICCLKQMHDLSILYRDLKLEHVLICGTGHIKLVDFGFSKQIATGKQTYTNCGTPEYVAPEVLKEIGTSFEADIWSLGVLLHEICCGKTPFFNEDPLKL